jgi:protein-S-isoprenylcysteine O-methyltransferase Ste14
MHTEPSGKRKLPWGKKGEYLVALQFALLLTLILLPVYPSSSGFKIIKTLTFMRWTILTLCWLTAILFGTTGVIQIKHFLTPLPYPVDHNQLVTTGIYALVRHPLYT